MIKTPLNQSNPDYNNKIYYDENQEQDMSEEKVEELDEDRNSSFTQERANNMRFDRDFAKLQSVNKTKPVVVNANLNPLKLITSQSPFEMKCWKGYKAKGKKKSPSGKKTKSGKVKMVNNCVKK
tara:strand:- start:10 stop:381 length:372 start_codon:yes stop_codon:yes gene_type:complete